MEKVLSWLLQPPQQSMRYFEDCCQSLLAFLELRLIAREGSSDAVLMLVQSLAPEKHISEYIEQSDRVLG